MTDGKPHTGTKRTLLVLANALLGAMRPRHWVKNVFVFAGILFARKQLMLHPEAVVKAAAAFLLFCLMSSAVYLINDLVDKTYDQHHPQKRFRPIASGKLPSWIAVVFAVVLPACCFAACAVFGLRHPLPDMGWIWFGVVLATYFTIQLAYSFALKHVVFMDLAVVTAGFVLRAIGGAAILRVNITPWWLLCVFFLALFLGLGKRRHELHLLEQHAGAHRRTLQKYSPRLLDQLLWIDIACIIIVYSQATFTSPLASNMPHPFLMLTIPLVVFGLFRYLYLIFEKEEGGEPVDLLVGDRPLVLIIIIWGLMVLFIQGIRY
jgi:4-hydroxybenzoate polyprenyltransferase